MTESAAILAELRQLAAKVDRLTARSPAVDPIVSRAEAASMLKVSSRQLRKLVAAGRLVAQPSGIARVELERYAKTPQGPLPRVVSKAKRERTASEEAERGRAMLKALRRRRAR